jgi:uncharacterized membrane protein
MASRRFWRGFAAGAAAGAGAGVGSWFLARSVFGRPERSVVRLEKSLQIGRPIEEVFRAWSDFERLPSLVRMLEEVRVRGKRSHWRVRLNGRSFEWDAELTQNIPHQALGWKSVKGPKHTGRINFSPLGRDSEIHVVMNYAPPGGELAGNLTGQTAALEHYLSQALRDFKAALEGKGQESAQSSGEPERHLPSSVPSQEEARATGTHGRDLDALSGHTQSSRFGGVPDTT